eukprot:SAG11_NODE_987_length_6278_cov_10.303447_6_plen_93_part_00
MQEDAAGQLRHEDGVDLRASMMPRHAAVRLAATCFVDLLHGRPEPFFSNTGGKAANGALPYAHRRRERRVSYLTRTWNSGGAVHCVTAPVSR